MQVVSKHDYSKAADVYSFGIILWEMMTWRLPWDDLNPFQVKCNTGGTDKHFHKHCEHTGLAQLCGVIWYFVCTFIQGWMLKDGCTRFTASCLFLLHLS